MLNYILSPLAQEDFENIWNYTAETWNPSQADKYFDKLMDGIYVIRKHSEIGRCINHVQTGYRSYVCESHLIIYRIIGENIDVIRILHQRMNLFDQIK